MIGERVVASKEDKVRIQEVLGIKLPIVSKALNFRADSMAARVARCYAVNTLGCRVFIRSKRII